MAISISILLVPGQRYDTLTTSDSGWVYDIAVEISEKRTLTDINPLSHAPYGWPVSYNEQLQPLLTVVAYDAFHAVNPSVTLMDVVKLWGPVLFALSLIPIFLIAKELGGDLAGVAAVLFAATMTSTIYWMKVGAYDREPLKLLLTATMIYFTIRMFKAPKADIPKYAILTGLALGLFAVEWPGGYFFVVIPIGGLIFVLLAGFIGKLIRKTSDFVGAVKTPLRNHLHLIIGVVMVMVVLTVIYVILGKQQVTFWWDMTQTMLGYVGVNLGGAGGGILPSYASESGATSSNLQVWFNDVFGNFYQNGLLTGFIVVLVALSLAKFVWSRKNWEILVLAWLVFVFALVFPGKGMARFIREWWPLIPAIAGVGFATLVSLFRRLYSEQSLEWLRDIENPVVVTGLVLLLVSPFMLNAYASASVTTPPTEWQRAGMDNAFLDSFVWLRDNTPENSVVAIEWSYGHLLTGVSRRQTVADGVESTGLSGVWENLTGAKPPDYIYTENSNGFLEQHFTINGRRTDVQRFPSLASDNEIAYYLSTYRDNYGVKIDYWIADAYQIYGMVGDIIAGDAKRSQSTGYDGNIIFDFGDENVYFDATQLEAWISGSSNSYFTGVIILYYNQSGGLSNFDYQFRDNTQIPRILKVYIPNYTSQPDLTQIVAVQSEPYFDGPPLYVRVFSGTGRLPDYMSVAYTSQNGLVKVVKINYTPSAVYPADGSSINDSTPELRSSTAIGATKYEFMLDVSSSFSSPIIQTSTTQPRYSPTAPLSDGTYWWRVAAYRGDELIGWSAASSFTVDTAPPATPELIGPQDGVVLTDLNVNFSWAPSDSGAAYHVQIFDERDLAAPLQENLVSAESLSHAFVNNGPYLWRVRAVDAAGNLSEWSENFRFTMRLPPQASSLISPPEGLVMRDNTPAFSWTSGIADNFRLLIDDDANFGSPVVDIDLSIARSYSVSEALPDDNYSWKVVSMVGAQQADSSVWTFVIDTTPPEIPGLLTPENGAIIVGATPTISWSPSSGTFRYGLIVDNDQGFTSPEVENFVDGTTFSEPDALPAGTYYWEVFAFDEAGNYSISPVRNFTIQVG